MEINTIIVQAGGKGTRLQFLTRNKPKALVPINNLPMIFHLFRKFPDKKFIIISDYKKDVMKKYLEAFADVKYLIVDGKGKTGTCAGIQDSISLIPDDSPFMLIWSDLVLSDDFELPCNEDNYIGISKDFTCRWSYINGEFKEKPSSEYGVAGLFIFNNKEALSNAPESGELVRWFSESSMKFNPVPLYKTKEYGLLSEYNKITEKRTGSNCRPFNSLEVNGDLITKRGIDKQGKMLAVREVAWYKAAVDKGFDAIPDIFSFEPLVMKKVNGANIFEYNFTVDEQKKVVEKLVNSLKNLHALGSVPADYFSIKEAYFNKTFDRLNKIRDMIPFADKEYIVINGKPCRNVFFHKDELEELICNYRCKHFEFIHGDNTFSNMMLNEKMEPLFIDPRGYFGFTELYGDPNYDWAKIYYSIVGNYDQFNLKNFSLEIKDNSVELEIQSNGWEKTESYFFELLGNDVNPNDIKLIHSIIWLSLTTYAWEDYDSICGAFYNGLLYLEDVLAKSTAGVKKEDTKAVNLSFDNTLNILTKSCRSIDDKIYQQLLDECEKTLKSGHKIITSGLGKNVPVCEKFTGSMLSLGLNASFLHTSNAVHGDMGMVRDGDIVILLTKSGATSESVYLADLLMQRNNVNLWLITFTRHSVLSERIKSLVIDLEHEGDLWNIMPNNSTILNLIVLQSLVMHLAERMNLSLNNDFKPNHPGGAIGKQLV